MLVVMPNAGLSPDIAAPAVTPSLAGAGGTGLFADLLAAAASGAPAGEAATSAAAPSASPVASTPNVVTLASLPQTEEPVPTAQPVEAAADAVPVSGSTARPHLPDATIPPSPETAEGSAENGDGADTPAAETLLSNMVVIAPVAPPPAPAITTLPPTSVETAKIEAIGSASPAANPLPLPGSAGFASPAEPPPAAGAASLPSAAAETAPATNAPPATNALAATPAETSPAPADQTAMSEPRSSADPAPIAASAPPPSPTASPLAAAAPQPFATAPQAAAPLPAATPQAAALEAAATEPMPTPRVDLPSQPQAGSSTAEQVSVPAPTQNEPELPTQVTASDDVARPAPAAQAMEPTAQSLAPVSETAVAPPPPAVSTPVSSTPNDSTPSAAPSGSTPTRATSAPAVSTASSLVAPVPPAEPTAPVINAPAAIVAAEGADTVPEMTAPPVTEPPVRTQILAGSAETAPATVTPASLPGEIAPGENASGESAGDDADQQAAETDGPETAGRTDRSAAADRASAPQLIHHAAQPTGAAPAAATTDPGGLPILPAPTALPPQTAAANPQQATLPSWINTAVPVALPGIAIEIARQARAGSSQFEIRLDPPELGRVDVSLNVDREGKVKAHLVVDRMETLDFMLRDQRQLEKMLAQAGFKTDQNAIDFSLRSDGGGFAGQGQAQQDLPQPQPRWTTEVAAADETALARTISTPSGNPAGRLDLTV